MDFAPVWDSKAPGVVPGGVPETVGADDPVTELSPIHFPYRDATCPDNGSGSTWSRNNVTYRYTTINAAGDRSFLPRPTVEFTFLEVSPTPTDVYTLRVPTLRHAIGPHVDRDIPTEGTRMARAHRKRCTSRDGFRTMPASTT